MNTKALSIAWMIFAGSLWIAGCTGILNTFYFGPLATIAGLLCWVVALLIEIREVLQIPLKPRD